MKRWNLLAAVLAILCVLGAPSRAGDDAGTTAVLDNAAEALGGR